MLRFIEKLFWPLIVLYVIYYIYQGYMYFTNINSFVDKNFFNQLYLKKFVIGFCLIAVAFILKSFGKKKLASLCLIIPAGIVISIVAITLLAWIFLALAMIIFGK